MAFRVEAPNPEYPGPRKRRKGKGFTGEVVVEELPPKLDISSFHIEKKMTYLNGESPDDRENPGRERYVMNVSIRAQEGQIILEQWDPQPASVVMDHEDIRNKLPEGRLHAVYTYRKSGQSFDVFIRPTD